MTKLRTYVGARGFIEAADRDTLIVPAFGMIDKAAKGKMTGRKIRYIFSTGAVDRMGDVIEPLGWDLRHFKTNPVAFFNHMTRELPIGTADKVSKDANMLAGTIEFCEASLNPLADSIYRMCQADILRATSVGFQPTDWEAIRKEDGGFQGYRFKKQSLHEISVVGVPANPEALELAKSWTDVDMRFYSESLQKALDGMTELHIPAFIERGQIEAALKVMTGNKTVHAMPETKGNDDVNGTHVEALDNEASGAEGGEGTEVASTKAAGAEDQREADQHAAQAADAELLTAKDGTPLVERSTIIEISGVKHVFNAKGLHLGTIHAKTGKLVTSDDARHSLVKAAADANKEQDAAQTPAASPVVASSRKRAEIAIRARRVAALAE